MTAYNLTPSTTFSSFTLSPDIAERKAARKQVIERARELERKSYMALMQRKRQLQAEALKFSI